MREPLAPDAIMSSVWKQLRRFLTADPGRFAGGSALSDPLGLLADERELLAAQALPPNGRILQVAARQDDRSPGRTQTVIQTLSPAYFPFVMATSIISTGTFLLGPRWLSRVLLVIALAGFAVLSVALVIQLAGFPSDVVAASVVRVPAQS